jgi:hypothetical protein
MPVCIVIVALHWRRRRFAGTGLAYKRRMLAPHDELEHNAARLQTLRPSSSVLQYLCRCSMVLEYQAEVMKIPLHSTHISGHLKWPRNEKRKVNGVENLSPALSW